MYELYYVPWGVIGRIVYTYVYHDTFISCFLYPFTLAQYSGTVRSVWFSTEKMVNVNVTIPTETALLRNISVHFWYR